MSKVMFDAKFGAELVSLAPTCPGVYRFVDDQGAVLYVGKAKNLRRRLSNYRNATRKRVHRKMRILVRQAASLSYETCESEPAALLLEGELIRKLRPDYNVDGAFAFLYPYLGVGGHGRTTLLCFTTHPDEFAELKLEWYGCFRSRPRVKCAFRALLGVLSFLAHREKVTQLPEHPRLKGSQLAGFRRVPREIQESLRPFFAGEAMTLPAKLARLLLDKPSAVQHAPEVQVHLQQMVHFFEEDAARLRATLAALGRSGHQVSQEERDGLFIRATAARRASAAETCLTVE